MASRHVRVLHRDLRGQQHHPRLGVRDVLTNAGEESVLAGHRQLHRSRVVHLDAVHVAIVRRAAVRDGHVVERSAERGDGRWCVGDAVLAEA